MKRTVRSDGSVLTATNLAAAAATFVFVLLVGWVAISGHQQATAAREATKPTHRMASLSQIHAVISKAQELQDAQDDANP
jgi:hypothetical protein